MRHRVLVRREIPRDRVAARLLLAVAHDPEGHRQRAPSPRVTRSPYCIQSCPCRRRRLARRATRRAPRPRTDRFPELERVRRLDVVWPYTSTVGAPAGRESRRRGAVRPPAPRPRRRARTLRRPSRPRAGLRPRARDPRSRSGSRGSRRARRASRDAVFRSGRHWPQRSRATGTAHTRLLAAYQSPFRRLRSMGRVVRNDRGEGGESDE